MKKKGIEKGIETEPTKEFEEQYFIASQWQLMGRKFKKHKLAILGGIVLAFLYFCGLFCEFIAPNIVETRNAKYPFAPPQKIHFVHEGEFRLRPFVYGIISERDEETWKKIYTENKEEIYPIHFFIRGKPYKMWDLFWTDVHLFGVKDGVIFLFGTDSLGRDLFTLNLYAARTSLSIGLVGVFLSFVLGIILGGVSGYYGGRADVIIQRIIEFLISIPTIPFWMALSAALPKDWPVIRIYFGITLILALRGWCGLARVVRGKILELREEDFVMAARLSALREVDIIGKHLLPGFLSYLIVHLTLAIPYMILAETSLSFLGLGLRSPAVSWGVLMHEAQNVRTIALRPWLMIPGMFVIVAVLAFNFLGDGLRDAADPYK